MSEKRVHDSGNNDAKDNAGSGSLECGDKGRSNGSKAEGKCSHSIGNCKVSDNPSSHTKESAKIKCNVLSSSISGDLLRNLLYSPITQSSYFTIAVENLNPGPVGGLQIAGQPVTVVAVDEAYGWGRTIRIGDKILGIERVRPLDAQHCQVLMNQNPVFELVVERPLAKLEATPMEPECDLMDLELLSGDGSSPKKAVPAKAEAVKLTDGERGADEEGVQFAMLPPDIQRILRRKRGNFEVDLKTLRQPGEFRHFDRKSAHSATVVDHVQKVCIRNDIPRWKQLRSPPKM
uniref:PDZ domain-containing protein n=1 Tax=Trichuris muris TaxID=70415 RepID=A0A5S6Q1U5_TRIMR